MLPKDNVPLMIATIGAEGLLQSPGIEVVAL